MGQILVIILVVLLVWFFFFRKKGINHKSRNKEDSNAKFKSSDRTMVECVRCGVYVSSDEAILSSGKYYCSSECLKG
jgi:uncharacterized protein